jgi:hypothetical protein
MKSQTYTKQSDEAGDADAVALLRDIADRAQQAGLNVSLYPHTWFWMERVQDAVRLARKADRPNVGVTFNLCHCIKVGDACRIGEQLDQAKPYLTFVTVNGADGEGGWDRLIQPLGQGSFDVGALLKSSTRWATRSGRPAALRHQGQCAREAGAVDGGVAGAAQGEVRAKMANSRRSFLKAMLAASAAPLAVPPSVLGRGATAPSERVTFGCIGTGGHFMGRNLPA